MLARVTNPNVPEFCNYGGRGSTVCDRLRESFQSFIDDMGECPPGLTLERIDNNKGYDPKNCKWATKTEQNGNRRDSVRVTVRGITGCLAQVCRHFNAKVERVRWRLYNGWPLEKAIFTPKRNC